MRFAVASAAGGIAERGGFRLFLLAVAGREPVLAGVLQLAFRAVEAARDLPQLFVHRYGLPALSRLRLDPAAFLDRLEAACRLAGLAFAPVFVGLALCAPELQSVFLGPRWAGIVAPVQVLAAALALTVSGLPLGVAFIAAGRPGLNMWLTAGSIALVLLLTALVPEDDAAAASAWAAALVASALAAGALAARCLGFQPGRQLRILASALPPAAAAAGAVLGAEAAGLLPVAWPLAALAAKAAIGGATAGALLVPLARRPWHEVRAPIPQAAEGPVGARPRPARRGASMAAAAGWTDPADAVPAVASPLGPSTGRARA